MIEEKPKEGGLKYLLGLMIITTIRIMPRPPNFEPIMATCMPYSKGYGWLRGILFSMFAIISYDLITHTYGLWTLVTAPTYGLVAAGAYFYLKNKPNKTINYVKYSIAATLFFDLITGIGMGYFIFKMPLAMVVMGQIPFTLMHLASSVTTALFSPIIYKWIVTNPNLNLNSLRNRVISIN